MGSVLRKNIMHFLKMMSLYSKKVCELSKAFEEEKLESCFSYLSAREKEFLVFLIKKKSYEFTLINSESGCPHPCESQAKSEERQDECGRQHQRKDGENEPGHV